MKFLCPQCERLVELRDFKLDGAALTIPCAACGNVARVNPASSPPHLTPGERPALQLTSVPGTSNVVTLLTPSSDAILAAAVAATSGPFDAPAGRCPKCIAPRQTSATTCTQCGLTFTAFDASQVDAPDWLKDAWVGLLADWSNEPLHAELRHRALADEALASLGRLYRLRLVSKPDDPFAQRGREEVLRIALMPSSVGQSIATEKIASLWKYVLAAVFLVVCVVVLVLMARSMLSPE